MTQESISDKLLELFELYKSGALTKEEYDLLKVKIINTDEIQNAKADKPTSVSLNKIGDEAENNAIEGKAIDNVEESIIKTKKKSAIIILFSIGILIILITIFLISKTNNSSNDATLSTSKVETKQNAPLLVVKKNTWDEVSATKVVMDELSKYPDWSKIATTDSAQWQHKILNFFKVSSGKTDFEIGLTFSNYDPNYCNACYGEVSIFEFKYQDVWKLARKSIAFTEGGAFGSAPAKMNVYNISADDYGLLMEASGGSMGEFNESKTLYAFINGEFKNVFEVGRSSDANDSTIYNMALNFIIKTDGYYDIEVVEKEKPEKGNEITKTAIYKFDGIRYVENKVNAESKRDPRAKDVANVFWNPEYTLFCKLSDEPIYPDVKGKYDLWYSSHEDPSPHHGILTKDEMQKLLFYKFKNYEECKKWCDSQNFRK